MHDLKWWLAVLAVVPTAGAYVCLIYDWKHGWLPARASWTIWIFITGFISYGMILKGAGETVYIVICFCIGTSTISALSFIRGEGGWTKTDKACITISALSLLGLANSNEVIFLLSNIFADLAAGWPTIERLWKDPKSESPIAWSLFLLGTLIDLMVVRNWHSVGDAVYPVFIVLFTGTMLLLTFRRPTK